MRNVPEISAHPHLSRLRATVLTVALLNLAYFFIEAGIALAIDSASLLADSVDFLEDTSVNLLILIALFWSLRRQALAGKTMALLICLPALVAAWEIFQKFHHPQLPEVLPLVVASGGAVLINGFCAYLLASYRNKGGSLTKAAFLSARNDVTVNLAVIVMGALTALTGSGWPDVVLAALILILNFSAAWEVWETAEEEHLAAKALAGEEID